MVISKSCKVLLVGLGNISLLYDFHSIENLIFTHAKAYSEDDFFQLVGGIDINKKNRDLFSEKYGCAAYEKIEDVSLIIKPELVVIATPTEDHFNSIEKSINFLKPKIIICEKPLSYSIETSKKIIRICKVNSIQLFINYPRISLPESISIKNKILENLYEAPFNGTVWYSKSLFSVGVHFLNLMLNFFGDIEEIKIINKGKIIQNKYQFAPSFQIRFQGGFINFISLYSQEIFMNEFKIIFKNGVLNYRNAGKYIEWFKSNNAEKTFSHNSIVSDSENIKSYFFDLQKYHIIAIKRFIKNEQFHLCSPSLAIKTEEVLDLIYNKCSMEV